MVIVFNCIILLIPSCKSSNEKTLQQDPKNLQEGLIRNQKQIVKDESLEVDEYIARRDYKMITTKTGLRYLIYSNGHGSQGVKNEDVVKINYTVSLLDGTKVYSSDSTGALQFKVGKSEVASGLQEGVTYMHVGDKAVFVVPAHLAYGLQGGENRIPGATALYAELEMLSVKSTSKK